MDITDAMDVQNLITFIHNCIVGKHMFRKRCKAHRHILFILHAEHRTSRSYCHFIWATLGV